MDYNLYPKVSFLDPTLTYTVSPTYTAYGGVDIISHSLEKYIANDSIPIIQQRFIESLIISIMGSIEKAIKEPEDYEARSLLYV